MSSKKHIIFYKNTKTFSCKFKSKKNNKKSQKIQ